MLLSLGLSCGNFFLQRVCPAEFSHYPEFVSCNLVTMASFVSWDLTINEFFSWYVVQFIVPKSLVFKFRLAELVRVCSWIYFSRLCGNVVPFSQSFM